MRSRVTAGALSGLLAGIAFGIPMQILLVPTPSGELVPMMAMVARVVGSTSYAVGWLYHLFNSALIGGIFGWALGSHARNTGSAVGLGMLYGMVWWVLGGLILMPVLIGMPAFSSIRIPDMRPMAMASLLGHLLYGLALGVFFRGLFQFERPKSFRLGTPHYAGRASLG